MKYAVYIASPFFNPEQLASVQAVEDKLDEIGMSYYSPRKSGIIFKDLSLLEREEASYRVFRENVENIDNSLFLLANIDDRDTGTSWEMGYHYGNRKQPKIVTFSAKGYGANVMLAKCTMLHLDSLEKVKDFLDEFPVFAQVTEGSLRGAVSRARLKLSEISAKTDE